MRNERDNGADGTAKDAHPRKASIIAGHHRYGRYRVTSYARDPRALAEWIPRHHYLTATTEAALMNKHGRAKNRLFALSLPCNARTVIMKVCSADPRYQWRRRLELIIRQWFRDYNLRAFQGCRALYESGLPVAAPLAWWQHHTGLKRRESYFLYQAIDADMSLSQWLETLNEQQLTTEVSHVLAQRITAIIRDIHAAGWRHGDVHFGNLLTVPPAQLNVASAQIMPIYLIDYDHCAPIRLRCSIVRCLFNLKCLSHIRLPHVSDEDLLSYYLNEPASPLQRATLSFWRNGGFSIARRSRKWRARRPRGAHLKAKYRNTPSQGRRDAD